MSQENIDLVRRCYDAMNEAYRTGDLGKPMEEFCHADVVLRTSGMFPESGDYEGHEGLREFAANQAEAFEQMWVRPDEFIDAEDRVVVPVHFGGEARHTGIAVAFSVIHVWTVRDLRVARLDMYRSRAEALDAVDRSE